MCKRIFNPRPKGAVKPPPPPAPPKRRYRIVKDFVAMPSSREEAHECLLTLLAAGVIVYVGTR